MNGLTRRDLNVLFVSGETRIEPRANSDNRVFVSDFNCRGVSQGKELNPISFFKQVLKQAKLVINE